MTFNYYYETVQLWQRNREKNYMEMHSNSHCHILVFVSTNTQFHKIKMIGTSFLFCSLRQRLSLIQSSSIKQSGWALWILQDCTPSPRISNMHNHGILAWVLGMERTLAVPVKERSKCVSGMRLLDFTELWPRDLFGQMRKRARHLGASPSRSTASCRRRAAGFRRKHFATARTRCPFSRSLTRQSQEQRACLRKKDFSRGWKAVKGPSGT